MNGLCDASRSTLIIIDLQERLMPAIHEGDTVVRNALRLSQTAKLLGIPVIGTAQNPEGLGPNVAEVHAQCEKVFAKMDFDACAEQAFLDALADQRGELIVAGCEAHVCVLQTVLGLLGRGRHVRLVADAIGSRVPFNRQVAMERAKSAGAELLTTEMVMFEWMRSAAHPRFKDMLRLVK
ncbi:isochorismatase family protein [Noviherbaspirillum malthae]|uniref:isochorismatase family protein n=1 Tax=Noviherbaspirillum malthae TaxID=1260987 RepID=UPI0018907404|nr:isochorismatase family protein [Noviherbaspirillum malthae]